MKRFLITVDNDDFTTENMESVLYLGVEKKRSQYPEIPDPGRRKITEIVSVEGRMTMAQREKLWELCGRYQVPFRESDYDGPFKGEAFFDKDLKGWIEGWVGGPLHNGHNNMKKTIYVGVDPEGNVHS